mgnify:CR=1 FL=1
MKYLPFAGILPCPNVTLRARVWVEIRCLVDSTVDPLVTLRARVWVEIWTAPTTTFKYMVTLRARVWVEICNRTMC